MKRDADGRTITIDGLSLVDYIQEGGVIHTDLKLKNIVLGDGKPMLFNFGKAGHNRVYSPYHALPSYMAPEMYATFTLKHQEELLIYNGKVGI